MSRLTKFGINFDEVIKAYARIDAYSQGKLKKSASRFSSRNMGKNAIWIAATASVFDLTLVTTDKDFHHLEDEFIKLKFIDIEEHR